MIQMHRERGERKEEFYMALEKFNIIEHKDALTMIMVGKVNRNGVTNEVERSVHRKEEAKDVFSS